ncbi:MAG: hypothetical protein N3A58_02825 [Spirochaetes bacterium]|nr:hypothetical protein [Spirochaetota bacterium]
MKIEKRERLKRVFIENLIKEFKDVNLKEIREIENDFLIIIFEFYKFENNKVIKKVLKSYFKFYKFFPLIITEEFLRNGIDVYGASIFFIKNLSKNIYGKSIINDIEIDNKLIRVEIEREFRNLIFNIINKSVLIRSKKESIKILKNTIKNYNFIFISLLYLLNLDYSLDSYENIRKLTEHYNIEAGNNILKILKEKINFDDINFVLDNFYIFINYLIAKVDKI